jgi:hypothetical protein
MRPAVVLQLSFKTIANVVAATVGNEVGNLIFHNRGSDAMYLLVDDVPLAVISFNREPREVRIYAEDRNVRGKSCLSEPLGRLPLSGIAGHWCVSEDQLSWPGSRSETFVIRHRGHGRLV